MVMPSAGRKPGVPPRTPHAVDDLLDQHTTDIADRLTEAQADLLYPDKTATEAAIARGIPDTSGSVGQHPTIGPSGPTWIDTTEYTVKHPRFAGGALGQGGTHDDTAAIQAAVDLAEAASVSGVNPGAIVRFPKGVYNANLTVNQPGITFRGDGKHATWLRTLGGDLITLDNANSFRVESMRVLSSPGGGHVFVIANSLSHALFFDLWAEQQNSGKSILWGDDTVTGTELNYIDNLWLQCETVHVESATVASFHLRGGAVNRNRWLSGRHTYTGNYAWLFEATAESSYANDNTIDGINMEVPTGGVVKGLGVQGLVLRDIAIYDLFNSTTHDLIHLGQSTVTPTIGARSVTLDNVRRNGFTLGSGLYDLVVATSASTPRVSIRNSGGSTSLAIDARHRFLLIEDSNVVLTNGGNVSNLDLAGPLGSTFARPAAFLSRLTLPSYTTAALPAAADEGAGAVVYDTTLGKPIWSDGTDWRDATGTVV